MSCPKPLSIRAIRDARRCGNGEHVLWSSLDNDKSFPQKLAVSLCSRKAIKKLRLEKIFSTEYSDALFFYRLSVALLLRRSDRNRSEPTSPNCPSQRLELRGLKMWIERETSLKLPVQKHSRKERKCHLLVNCTLHRVFSFDARTSGRSYPAFDASSPNFVPFRYLPFPPGTAYLHRLWTGFLSILRVLIAFANEVEPLPVRIHPTTKWDKTRDCVLEQCVPDEQTGNVATVSDAGGSSVLHTHNARHGTGNRFPLQVGPKTATNVDAIPSRQWIADGSEGEKFSFQHKIAPSNGATPSVHCCQ